jgi:hypothetical protein
MLVFVALQQYVPLFLRKEDLDVAVAGAYKQRNAAQIQAVRSKAAEHEKEYQEIMRKVGQGEVPRPWKGLKYVKGCQEGLCFTS